MWTFPSPPVRAWSRTCTDCARLCGECAAGWAANIRNGWKYRSTCTDGRSAVRSRIWGILRSIQCRQGESCRTGHSAIPCVYRAFALGAGQKFLSAPAFRLTTSGDPRRRPGIRVGDTSGLTQAPRGDDRLLSRLTEQCTSTCLAVAASILAVEGASRASCVTVDITTGPEL